MADATPNPIVDVGTITSDPEFEITSVLYYSTNLPPAPTDPSQTTPLSNYHLLQYSIDRLREAATNFSWPSIAQDLDQPDILDRIMTQTEAHLKEQHGPDTLSNKKHCFILRLAFKKDGKLDLRSMKMRDNDEEKPLSFYPLNLPPPSLNEEDKEAMPVYLDTQHINPSLFMKHKTSYRDEYNVARKRVGIEEMNPSACEVLLHNEHGNVTGGAFSTIYFWRNGNWVTPLATSGCKLGVSRRWAVENGVVREADVSVQDLKEGEVVWMSTAVTGFSRGIITLEAKK